jgi:hypothetical protein
MVLLWPRDPPKSDSGGGPTRVSGHVLAVQPAPCPDLPDGEEQPPDPPTACGTATVNTIVLACAGASLPLMLLFATGGTPVGELLTSEFIAQELIRSAVGTIGLITAVPITTALAAYVATRHITTAEPPQHQPISTTTTDTAPTAAAGPAPEDPWMAFVDQRPHERH